MQNNLTKIVIGLLAVVIIFLGYLSFSKNKDLINNTNLDLISGNKEDLLSFSIIPEQKVFGKMLVTGSIQGGYFFEGNLPVTILDSNKNPTSYGPGHGQ